MLRMVADLHRLVAESPIRGGASIRANVRTSSGYWLPFDVRRPAASPGVVHMHGHDRRIDEHGGQRGVQVCTADHRSISHHLVMIKCSN